VGFESKPELMVGEHRCSGREFPCFQRSNSETARTKFGPRGWHDVTYRLSHRVVLNEASTVHWLQCRCIGSKMVLSAVS